MTFFNDISSQVGGHDKLGMQLVPLKLLKPYENKEFTLDLLKDTNINETPNKKPRGKIVVDLTFVPFREDSIKFGGSSDRYERKDSGVDSVSDDEVQDGAGLLSVVIQEADEVEGEHHNDPYAVLTFRGEKKRTKVNFHLQYNCATLFSFLLCTSCYFSFLLCTSCYHLYTQLIQASYCIYLKEFVPKFNFLFADDEENPSPALE